jgi:hypothetical protein
MITDEIGAAIFHAEYTDDGRIRSISAVEIPERTVVSPEVLAAALAGDGMGCRVEFDLLVFELANGIWVYQLGAYNPRYRGIDARLVGGDGPIKADNPAKET